MTISAARRVSLAMVVLATCAMWLAAGLVEPAVVLAAACCSECEAKEAACYASCDATTHGTAVDDARQECYDKCYYELYERTAACWRHCVTCSPGLPDPAKCFTFVLTHEYYCYIYGEGYCLEWRLVPGQDHGHVFASYQTSSGHCTN